VLQNKAGAGSGRRELSVGALARFMRRGVWETEMPTFDPQDVISQVKATYRRVAADPHGGFHFEVGRSLAEQLGYATADLDRIPGEAIESFAGVGHHFQLADLKDGETVLDLGSGSGMDTFIAALKVGPRGKVIGVDMTDEQRAKAERSRESKGFGNVTFVNGYIEDVPVPNVSVDVVISNGVINLSVDKPRVFREAARLLKSSGRLAISDIVTGMQLPDDIVGNPSLWAACIGGATQPSNYRAMMEAAGLQVMKTIDNPAYPFISDGARGAAQKFGVKSVSMLAVKP
jgi:SAM-dependent methyltransferase